MNDKTMQPSDNLQQASTAQVDCTEPNRVDCPRKCIDFCNKAEEAASTTDCRSPEGVATGLIDGIIAIARVLRKSDLSHPAIIEALKDLGSDEDVAALICHPSQATPEGAELPPLPPAYAFAPSDCHTGDPYADAEDAQDDMCQEFASLIAKGIYTADQMRDYARAAVADMDGLLRASVPERHKSCTSPVGSVQSYIAELEEATTAAEPVYQVFEPALGAWLDLSQKEMGYYAKAEYKTRTLYRAAPPQQVEPICCNHN